MISFDDFKKVEIRIGKILSAKRIEGSDKLLALMVDLGAPEAVQILSGIAKFYEPEALVGKSVPIIVNLEPRQIMGQTSNGMMLCAIFNDPNDPSGMEKPVLLHPDTPVPSGSLIR